MCLSPIVAKKIITTLNGTYGYLFPEAEDEVISTQMRENIGIYTECNSCMGSSCGGLVAKHLNSSTFRSVIEEDYRSTPIYKSLASFPHVTHPSELAPTHSE